MGAPEITTDWRSHGLVARRYEPLADGSLEREPGQTHLLQSNQKTQPNPVGAWLCSLLLNFHFGAGVFHLLLDGLGFRLVDAFLDRLRRAVGDVLPLLGP